MKISGKGLSHIQQDSVTQRINTHTEHLYLDPKELLNTGYLTNLQQIS